MKQWRVRVENQINKIIWMESKIVKRKKKWTGKLQVYMIDLKEYEKIVVGFSEINKCFW